LDTRQIHFEHRMKVVSVMTRISLMATIVATSRSAVVRAFSARPVAVTALRLTDITDVTGIMPKQQPKCQVQLQQQRRSYSTTTTLQASAGSDAPPPSIRQIGKAEMAEIVEDYEAGGRQDSGYLILDVRGDDEVMYTGRVSPNTITLPLPIIMTQDVFALEEEQFEAICGFEKPQLDETLVFTCAAGIRSQHAAFAAGKAGYSSLINYAGGANEWFR